MTNVNRTKKERIIARDGFKCVYCDSPNLLTVDHLHARIFGGKAKARNLVCCCLDCNQKKSNLTVEGFLVDEFGLSPDEAAEHADRIRRRAHLPLPDMNKLHKTEQARLMVVREKRKELAS